MKNVSLPKLYFLLFICGLLCIESCSKEEEVDPYEESYIGPGSSAKDYLRSNQYTSLLIEIVYEVGVEPDQRSVNELDSFLRTYLNKPKGIKIIQREIEDQKENSLSSKEMVEFEQKHRNHLNSKDTLATFIFFANSKFSESKSVLGLAYAPTSITIFEKMIRDNADGNVEVIRRLEESILKHEFGHLLGLVDIGSPPVNAHEDPDYKDHCDNKDCLMYWAVQSAATANNISLILDDNCIADLRANGGK